ncbi:WXG100 family type VII secretion target [Nocardioides sp. LHG3406-4]|uniref:WXG100 family type VII secretion target n=1 Tax=Nocardioides sp. LHG3406-4 TaxID=2804575 RepID=UPI003CF579E9
MGDVNRFTVDSDELDAVIADVEKTEAALQSLTEDLEAQIKALQSVWGGLAADAQQAAQQEWDQGMAAMRTALNELRQAARAAHGNYTGAATTNVTMWESLS